jgi:hypothetical protein
VGLLAHTHLLTLWVRQLALVNYLAVIIIMLAAAAAATAHQEQVV